MLANQNGNEGKAQEAKAQEAKKPRSIYADINADDGISYEMSKRYKKAQKA